MDNNRNKKVVVGMSGGVDSSVSAWLLQKQGYHVEGLFMKNWEEDDNEEYCSSAKDLLDAQSVCDKLGIILHKINFSNEYWNNVFEHCISEYQRGRTPNPDILCNKEIKFKSFLLFAIEDLGAQYIATGHYVRSAAIHGKSQLLRGLDPNKDQSYFLYTLDHKQIVQCLFPLGNMIKSTVRNIATTLALSNANKKDSTGICFIGKRNIRKFLGRYLTSEPGKIISIDGQEVGQHQGLIYYTIGQRKGIGIGGRTKSREDPWYVVAKDLNKNTLIVVQGHHHPCLMSSGLIASNLYWIDRKILQSSMRCTVKTRYRQKDIGCLVEPIENNMAKITFDDPLLAVTPGQSAVFYLGYRCLGGGIIEETIKSDINE